MHQKHADFACDCTFGYSFRYCNIISPELDGAAARQTVFASLYAAVSLELRVINGLLQSQPSIPTQPRFLTIKQAVPRVWTGLQRHGPTAAAHRCAAAPAGRPVDQHLRGCLREELVRCSFQIRIYCPPYRCMHACTRCGKM